MKLFRNVLVSHMAKWAGFDNPHYPCYAMSTISARITTKYPMRTGIKTLGKLAELVALPNGLKNIRNLGVKSEREILRSFVELCYEKLNYREKLEFWQKAISTSSRHD